MRSSREGEEMNKQEFRLAFLQNAIADIGKGEEGGNNDGPYVRGLLDGVGVDYPAAWCTAAVWRWIELAEEDIIINANSSVEFDFSDVSKLYTPSARAMFNAAKELGWVLAEGKRPEPGDIMIVKRTAYDANGHIIDWLGHAAVVENKKQANRYGPFIPVIEGNVGPYPAKVRRSEYVLPIKGLLGFIRLFGDGEQ